MFCVRHVTALITCSVLSLPCVAQEMTGENCDLKTPPPSAGEIFFAIDKLTIVGRVYPRLSDIEPRFTGCQVTWTSMNGKSTMRSLTVFRDGLVVSVNPLPDGIPLCERGEKAAETGCTSRRNSVSISFPAGCAARTAESKAAPKDCTDAFLADFNLNAKIVD